MKKILLIIMCLGLSGLAYGQVSISADVFNRYVWRGTDFGNAASIQPSIEYSAGAFTVGAWSAWAVNGATGGNENDLYISAEVGPVVFTVTDYFFPGSAGGDDIFDLDNHVMEITASGNLGPASTLLAVNVSGDTANSAYLEVGYGVLTLGLGNGVYVANGSDFNLVNVGVTASKDIFTATYMINPEQKTSFLVFGFTL